VLPPPYKGSRLKRAEFDSGAAAQLPVGARQLGLGRSAAETVTGSAYILKPDDHQSVILREAELRLATLDRKSDTGRSRPSTFGGGRGRAAFVAPLPAAVASDRLHGPSFTTTTRVTYHDGLRGIP
jgi:hypothetical protein